MTKYISMLRGINVSGKKTIRMADLKSLYESLGFQRVITYIQSGNVIFECNKTNKDKLKTSLEINIEENYKFHVPVQIRTALEFGNIIDNCPFNDIDISKDGTRFLVTFLSSTPAQNKLSEIQEFVTRPEKLVIIGQEVYLYCPNGYGKSKLSNNSIENKLEVSATTRNWKTVHKLFELTEPSQGI